MKIRISLNNNSEDIGTRTQTQSIEMLQAESKLPVPERPPLQRMTESAARNYLFAEVIAREQTHMEQIDDRKMLNKVENHPTLKVTINRDGAKGLPTMAELGLDDPLWP